MILPFYLANSLKTKYPINIAKSLLSYVVRVVSQGPTEEQWDRATLKIKIDGEEYKTKYFPIPNCEPASYRWYQFVFQHLTKLQATMSEKQLTATANDAYFVWNMRVKKLIIQALWLRLITLLLAIVAVIAMIKVKTKTESSSIFMTI